ncbi:PadR family transcriptional regulator [Micromonospora sp. RTP1Z1]|uniref:PadR family transcriptional regulator n=1 Tax=Micromonospora sp. RTP1Z1 TaxID=2994043 RepID=UPI0029C83C4E|nr:PadR family transcriptional regulator [Micromonospora sp. RTP1Z1]
MAADPSRWRYGYDLASEVHLKSGSLYPILVRLADRGLLEATWEVGPEGRPPRHMYRLSGPGREYVAALPPVAAVRIKPRPNLRLSEASCFH